jgi:uncharacterized membrane protein YhaH (DUF805 family)
MSIGNRVQYNNNIFSFNGKIGRLSYILQNFIINIIGFKYIYYPAIVESYSTFLTYPESSQILRTLSMNPMYASLFESLAAAPKVTTAAIIIKYLFLIPLRLIDIKRIRDIVDDKLSMGKTLFYAIFLSLPMVDLLATVVLSIVKPNRFAKNEFDRVVKDSDLKEAKKENELIMYKRLFDDGKISRAEYQKILDKHKLNL